MEFWKTASKRAGSKVSETLYVQDIQAIWEDHGVNEHFAEIYEEEILSWKWEDFMESADKAKPGDEYVVVDDFDSDITYYSEFIGSVFSVYPSGKFWTFWANSNMTMKEMVKDSIYQETLEFVANEKDCWVENGQGDPCDLFLCKSIDVEEEEED